MATLKNKQKLAAFSKETQELTRKSHSENTFAPEITKEYNTQVSEEIESRVTKKLSQEFSRTDSRFLGALYKLDEFLLNPQTWIFSGTVPGTSRNNDLGNREPIGDRSETDPYPKVECSTCQNSNSVDSDQEEASHRCISETKESTQTRELFHKTPLKNFEILPKMKKRVLVSKL